MANTGKDASGTTIFLKTFSGDGSSGSPYIFSSALPQFSNIPSTATITTIAGDLFTLAAGEIGYVQNLGINPLYIRRATGATTSAFHYLLSGCNTQDDGTGGTLIIDDHIGIVSISGTSPRCIAWKIS